jgi:hypothetical protein
LTSMFGRTQNKIQSIPVWMPVAAAILLAV